MKYRQESYCKQIGWNFISALFLLLFLCYTENSFNKWRFKKMTVEEENCLKCNGELEYLELGNECPNEIWVCLDCDTRYDVPMIREWNNKEEVE